MISVSFSKPYFSIFQANYQKFCIIDYFNISLSIFAKDYSIITSVTYTDRKEIDSNNLLILDKYLHLDTASLLGYSGSPVFLKESNCNRLRLIGVFSGFGYNKTYKKRAFLSIAKLDSDVFDITKYIQH